MPRDSDSPDVLTRRNVIGGTATGMAAMLAGCLGGGGDGTTTAQPADTGTTTPQVSDKAMEVIVPWSGGDGKAAFKAVKNLWRQKHPDMSMDFKTVASLGANNKIVYVNQRMRNRNPPGSFQAWPGANLQRFGGLLRSITGVWEENGFTNTMNQKAAELCKLNGEYRAVPLGSHRMNNLFYNTSVLEQAGVDPANLGGIDAFINALDKINKNTDAVPMAASEKAPWTNLQKWVEIFIAMHGAQAYRNWFNGEGDKAKVKSALQKLKTILKNYVNEDSGTVSFLKASDRLINGNAAVMHQGNWLYAKFRKNDNFNYQDQWDWRTFPGTGDFYVLHIDGFTFPRDADTPTKQELWAKHLGQKDVQIAFNNKKGAAPLRTDVDRSKLDPFLQLMAKHLKNKPKQVPTLAHGLAVPSDQLGACKSAIGNSFMGPYNVDATANGLMKAVK